MGIVSPSTPAGLGGPGASQDVILRGVTDELQDKGLNAQRAAAGGTDLATRLALGGRRLAINLGGGFHHARPGKGADKSGKSGQGARQRTLLGEGANRNAGHERYRPLYCHR